MKIASLTISLIANRLAEGGPMMYLILIAFLMSLVFIVLAFVKRKSNTDQSLKMMKLSTEASLLALVLGCLGSVVGIVQLFDMVEAVGNVSPSMFSGGLKVSLLTITFGLFSFTVGRVAILAYKWSS